MKTPLAGFNSLPARFQRRQVPPVAPPANDPKATLRRVEGKASSNRELFYSFVVAQWTIAEQAGGVHDSSYVRVNCLDPSLTNQYPDSNPGILVAYRPCTVRLTPLHGDREAVLCAPPSIWRGRTSPCRISMPARVAELADAQDSGSCGNNIPWGFDSPPEHSSDLPRWRNWQTRQLEGLVAARSWRFESSSGHAGKAYLRPKSRSCARSSTG